MEKFVQQFSRGWPFTQFRNDVWGYGQFQPVPFSQCSRLFFGNGSLLTEVVEKILYCQPGPEPSVFCDFFLELSKLLSFFSEFLRATLYKRDPTLSVGVNHRDSRIQSAAPYECSLDVLNKIGRKYVADLLPWARFAKVREPVQHGRNDQLHKSGFLIGVPLAQQVVNFIEQDYSAPHMRKESENSCGFRVQPIFAEASEVRGRNSD